MLIAAISPWSSRMNITKFPACQNSSLPAFSLQEGEGKKPYVAVHLRNSACSIYSLGIAHKISGAAQWDIREMRNKVQYSLMEPT